MVDGFAKTPRFVLKEKTQPTGPIVEQVASDAHPFIVCQFPDKTEYDVFASGRSLAWTPHPPVKGGSENPVELDEGSVALVVLDAFSSAARCLLVATFQSALSSVHHDLECVAISHRLMISEASSDFRTEEALFFRWTLRNR